MTTGSYVYGNTSTDVLSSSKSWNGQDDPLHKRENTYTMSGYRQVQSLVSIYRNSDGQLVGTFFPRGAMSLDQVWEPNDELVLLGRLQSQISAGFNAGVFAATFGQSLATVTNTAGAVLKSLRSLTRGDVVGAVRALGRVTGQKRISQVRSQVKAGDISAAWLSLQYGWLPLLGDCFEAVTAIEKIVNSRKLTYRASFTKKAYKNCALSARDFCIWTDVLRVGIKATLNEDVSVPRSLGLTDPFSIAWELLPWSFVVDWFIPIGDFLEASSYFRSLNISWVRSQFQKGTGKWLFSTYGSPGQFTLIGGEWRGDSARLDRTVGVGINVPFPNRKSISKALSLGHLRNAAALIHQLTQPFNKVSTGRPLGRLRIF